MYSSPFAELLHQWAANHKDDGLNDIGSYAKLFRFLASQCNHITEFGVRNGISTGAFLSGMPKEIVCYDIVKQPNMTFLEAVAQSMGTIFTLMQQDTTTADIAPTDLLFIDGCHRYSAVSKELKNSHKVRKYIVFHDTVGCWKWEEGNPLRVEGIGRAIQELLAAGDWELTSEYDKGSGLMVLSRKS